MVWEIQKHLFHCVKNCQSKAIHEKEYAQIWLRAENVFLPHHLQPMGTLFTARMQTMHIMACELCAWL